MKLPTKEFAKNIVDFIRNDKNPNTVARDLWPYIRQEFPELAFKRDFRRLDYFLEDVVILEVGHRR